MVVWWWFTMVETKISPTYKNKAFIESMPNNQVINGDFQPSAKPPVRDAITGAAATIPTQLVLFLFTQKKKKTELTKVSLFYSEKKKKLNSKESV